MTKTFEYFVVQSSGEFLTEHFPSEDMSEAEMLEHLIKTVTEDYEDNFPDDLLQKIYNRAYTLQGLYTLGEAMTKKYELHLLDIQFHMADEDGNELLNKDGSVKIFTDANNRFDFSWVTDALSDIDAKELVEIDNK